MAMSGRALAQALRRFRILPHLLHGGGQVSIRNSVQLSSDVQLSKFATDRLWTSSWREFASSSAADGGVSFQDPEVKEIRGTWVVKGLVLAMLTYIGMNVMPVMGDSMVRQSIALVKVKDPFLKRSGASRLTLIATDDVKRRRILEAGGVVALMNMLKAAGDDDTRREAVKALAMLAPYDPAVEAMHDAGGQLLMHTLSKSTTDKDMQEHSSVLLEKMEQWKASNTN